MRICRASRWCTCRRLWGAKYRSRGVDKSAVRPSCWNDGGGGAGVAIADLSHCGDFQAKGAANRGKPLSAPAVSGAAASASAALPEKRRSELLDSGKSMVQRLASSVADCETGNSSGLAANRLEGVLEVAVLPSTKGWSPDDQERASSSYWTHGC
jgi:hypothetical protein